jgi:acetyl esterase/lipase
MFRQFKLFVFAFFRTIFARARRGPLRPTWSLPFEVMIRYLRSDWDEVAGWPLERLRPDINGRFYPHTSVRRVTTRDRDLGGIPTRMFEPPEARPGTAVLYFHGGSFIYGSPRSTHAELLARLALESHLIVAAPEYRLAPQHPHPAQIDDAELAYEALVSTGARVVVAGDSAGGNLALMLALRLRDRGALLPDACALISPWSDLSMPGASFVANDPYDFGTRDELTRHARAYAGEVPLDSALVSPLRARLDGLPPVLVTAGEVEILRDDILALANALEAARVTVVRHVAVDMPHNAPVFAAYHPAAAECMRTVAAFASHFARPERGGQAASVSTHSNGRDPQDGRILSGSLPHGRWTGPRM